MSKAVSLQAGCFCFFSKFESYLSALDYKSLTMMTTGTLINTQSLLSFYSCFIKTLETKGLTKTTLSHQSLRYAATYWQKCLHQPEVDLMEQANPIRLRVCRSVYVYIIYHKPSLICL